jgi:adenine-specific DNA-methyltransferase
MRQKNDEGPLFSLTSKEAHLESVATGEISPYSMSGEWGNGANPEAQKELGQVATPPEIAQIMARWIAANDPSVILDPAAGVGNLLFEAHNLCQWARLLGIEQDASTRRKAVLSAPLGTRLILADYLKSRIEEANAIIANPPYIKAHHLEYSEDDWRSFETAFGTRLDRLTNIYALFLLKIWEDLAQGGRAAVIIPAEFLNANFGTAIKARLLRAVRPAGIAVFDPSFSVFKNALTTSCILFIHKGRDRNLPILALKVANVEETGRFVGYLLSEKDAVDRDDKCLDISSWNPADKWLNRVLGLRMEGLDMMPKKIGDYFRCRRGIATGANDYFTLSLPEIKSKSLSLSDFTPCIVHATYARGPIFTKGHFAELLRSGKKCYLLDPKNVGGNLESYLEEGVKAGISERHLPSHRPVWYLPENREPADIWVGVFSRKYLKCVMNDARAKNLTCFHGLYRKTQQTGLPELMTLFMTSTCGKAAFSHVNRFYGNGLNKLEPKDVEAMPCPVFNELDESETMRLRQLMAELVELSLADQLIQIDNLLKKYLGLNC